MRLRRPRISKGCTSGRSAARRPRDFDIELFVEDDAEGGLSAVFSYNTDLFRRETVARLASHFQHLLEASRPIRRRASRICRSLGEDEARELVTARPTCDFTADRCIHECIAAMAARHARRTALRCGRVSITYAELDRRATQLARRLTALGVGPDVLVGLWLERSIEMVVAILAVLEAGGGYVPIDPAYPRDRASFVLEDAQPPVVLTVTSLAGALPAFGGRVLCLDDLDAVAGDEAALPQTTAGRVGARQCRLRDLHVGIHRTPQGRARDARERRQADACDRGVVSLRERDVWTLFHSYAFDFSVWEISAP